MTLTVSPLAQVGVEVKGLDLTRPVDSVLAQELVSLWNEHGLLLFREQHISPLEQIAFSKVFGPLESHPLKETVSREYPELFTLVNEPEKEKFMTAHYGGKTIVGRLDWHIDLHYIGKPNRGAVLRSVVCAERDGQTGFGDLAKAWAALDADTQQLLQSLEVAYTFCMQRRHMRYVQLEGYEPGEYSPKKPSDMGLPMFADTAYPARMVHPVTGVPVLGVVEQFLDRVVAPHRHGLSGDEAIDLLQRLVAHTRREEFHYFHQWQPGDMILWDNWRFMHCATGTAPGVQRVIHRTTIAGDATLGRVLQ